MIPKPKAVVFDLDGTLVDSEPWHKKAEVEGFALLGLTVTAEDLMPCTGLTLPDMLRRIGDAHGRPLTVEEFLGVQQEILQGYIDHSMEAFPDALELANALNVPLAIGTSSMKWYLDSILNRFTEIACRFPVRVCQADVSNGKPHPETFLTAFARLGVAPEAGWVIEDSINGVRAGRAAGAFVIGVDREGHGHLSEADTVVLNLRDCLVFS